MKKISIIMGVYNCSLTLKDSIDSILKQTYTNWHFIICDDCSTDDTLSILYSYKELLPEKFTILTNQTNLGLNETLNNCIRVADGDYIARQDGDDISSPERFSKEVEFLNSHNEYAIVSSFMEFFDEAGVWGVWKTPEYPERIDLLKNDNPCFCHAPCMIRKEAVVSVGGYSTNPKYLRCEDINLWYKLYEHGYKGYNIQEPLYQMRDDHNAFKRRTIRNRINIIRTEYDGFKRLNSSFFEYSFFIKKTMKNLLLIITPEFIYKRLHNKRLKRV